MAAALLCAVLIAPVRSQVAVADPGVGALVLRIEGVIRQGDPTAYMDLLAPLADWARAQEFATTEIRPAATRVILRERNRYPLPGFSPGAGFRLLVDSFVEHGGRARAATWLIDIERNAAGEWRISDQVPVSVVDGLHRIVLDATRQFRARNYTVRAEDMELTLTEGTVFLIRTGNGETGMVLTGRGEMRFRPAPAAEQGQVRLLTGSDTLVSSFDAAYIRAAQLDGHADLSTLVTVPVDTNELRRAENVFREESSKTYTLDLGDLSPDRWSSPPTEREFLAEIRTRRFGTLTYVRTPLQAEDISVFNRSTQQYVSLYASRESIETRGRFFDEDEQVPYDVLDYDIDVTYTPDGTLLDGRSRMHVRIEKAGTTQLNLRLADALNVRSVTSDEFGRLFTVRARGQHLLIVNLPEALEEDREITLNIAYGGILGTQGFLREALEQQTFDQVLEQARQTGDRQINRQIMQIRYLYSGQVSWYPQSLVSDYATARLRVTLPDLFECVGTGELDPDSPSPVDGLPGHRQYLFTVERPVRYLAFMATRLEQADRVTVVLPNPAAQRGDLAGDSGSDIVAPAGVSTAAFPSYRSLDVTIEANPRLEKHGQRLGDRATEIARFYHSLVGDVPYKSLTVVLVETRNYDGHSPAHLALIGEPVPGLSTTPPAANPINFTAHPDFVLAHEIAHQWWGQAVGYRNYHEQWLSEAFAQYFAALFVRHDRGDEAFAAALRQMRDSAMDNSDQGPIYLGYRLGAVRNARAVFRALVYNKGAAVLHMLHRFVGDEAFLAGMRHFYTNSRFTKAGTEDLRRAMETASGKPLERFFENWVYGSGLPDLRFSYRVESGGDGQTAVLRFEQRGDLFDVPVTVTLQYTDRRSVNVPVNVSDQIVETRVRLDGTLRSVSVREDDGTLAEVRRQ